MSSEVKHQLLIFDQQLCQDSSFGKMILESLKSTAILANHFGSLNHSQSSTLSICVLDLNSENIDLRPVLSPPTFMSSSTMQEVLAAIEAMTSEEKRPLATLDDSTSEEAKTAKYEIEWSNLASALMPFVHFPAQEGYRTIIFTRKTLKINGWVQQPNCLLLQFVHIGDLNFDFDGPAIPGPMEENTIFEGFSQVEIPPKTSEWDTFFKLHVFEMYLAPEFPLVIHFSTSIYSKLIITCSAKPQCLSLFNTVKDALGMLKDSTKCVLETVQRVPKSGICQGLLLSQAFIIKPKDASRHDFDENYGNRMRFKAFLKELVNEDYVMILRTLSNPDKQPFFIKHNFVLIPSEENEYFLMMQIASSELLLPESDFNHKSANDSTNDFEGEATALMEMRSALQKIPIQIPTFDILEFSSGIVKSLEGTLKKKVKKPTVKSSSGATTSMTRGSGTSTRGGRGRGRGGSNTQPKKYGSVVRKS